MIRLRQGKVLKVLADNPVLQELLVLVEGEEAKAVNYTLLAGVIHEGAVVALNTTAVHKSLGTGGQHFVMANISNPIVEAEEQGHIMKLRYTPGQVKCLSVEEEDSPYHDLMRNTESITGMPVVVSTLHSMLPLIAAGIRSINPDLKVIYIMTDGAALPLWFSKMAANLKDRGWLNKTITIGHAFGGDFDAVNIYSGLIAAKAVADADITIVGMGPGIVGTGTPLGFTGVEQGEIINAVNILGGKALAAPRVSFADARERHRGLSHHSITALGKIALTRAILVLHQFDGEKMKLVQNQLAKSGIMAKHEVRYEDGGPAVDIVKEEGIRVTTMGRSIDQDLDFFLTSGAVGRAAAKLLNIL